MEIFEKAKDNFCICICICICEFVCEFVGKEIVIAVFGMRYLVCVIWCAVFDVGYIYVVLLSLSKNTVVLSGRGALFTLFCPDMGSRVRSPTRNNNFPSYTDNGQTFFNCLSNQSLHLVVSTSKKTFQQQNKKTYSCFFVLLFSTCTTYQ